MSRNTLPGVTQLPHALASDQRNWTTHCPPAARIGLREKVPKWGKDRQSMCGRLPDDSLIATSSAVRPTFVSHLCDTFIPEDMMKGAVHVQPSR